MAIFQLADFGEGVAACHDGGVLFALLDFGLKAKSKAKVILDRCVPLVCDFHLSVREHVNSIFVDFVEPSFRCLVVHRGLDHGALAIDEVYIQNFALSSLIFVLFDRGLLHNSSLEPPVGGKLVQGAQRHILVTETCPLLALHYLTLFNAEKSVLNFAKVMQTAITGLLGRDSDVSV